jgi:hypothetical protein
MAFSTILGCVIQIWQRWNPRNKLIDRSPIGEPVIIRTYRRPESDPSATFIFSLHPCTVEVESLSDVNMEWEFPVFPFVHDPTTDGRTTRIVPRNIPLPEYTEYSDPAPSYCPLYPIANHECAYIRLSSPEQVRSAVWIMTKPPTDSDGRLIQLYLHRRVCVYRQHGRVIGYALPRFGFVWVIVRMEVTQNDHVILIGDHWVEAKLRETIARREMKGDTMVEFGT